MSSLHGFSSSSKSLHGITSVVADIATISSLSLKSLSVGGNITQSSGTASLQAITTPSVSCSGNITGSTVTASQLVVAGNVSQTSGTSSLQAITTPEVTCSGMVTANHASLKTLYVTNNITGSLVTASQPSITSVGNLLSLVVAGNISQSSGSASLQPLTVPSISCSGNITGTIVTPSQPYINSIGDLTSLSVETNTLYVNDGKIGIGTTTPFYQFESTGSFCVNSGLLCADIDEQKVGVGVDYPVSAKLVIYNGDTTLTNLVDCFGASTSGDNTIRLGRSETKCLNVLYNYNVTEPYANISLGGSSVLTCKKNSGFTIAGNITQSSGSASLQSLTVPSISCSGNITGSIVTPSQPSITSIGNLSSLTVAGNISQSSGSASLQSLTVPSISCSGNISGTLTTASQTSITSVGNLSSLTVAGNISQSSGTSASLKSLTVPEVYISGSSPSLWIRGNTDNTDGRIRIHHSGTSAYIDWQNDGGDGALNFRYDTTVRAKFDSDGYLYSGGLSINNIAVLPHSYATSYYPNSSTHTKTFTIPSTARRIKLTLKSFKTSGNYDLQFQLSTTTAGGGTTYGTNVNTSGSVDYTTTGKLYYTSWNSNYRYDASIEFTYQGDSVYAFSGHGWVLDESNNNIYWTGMYGSFTVSTLSGLVVSTSNSASKLSEGGIFCYYS